MMRFLQIVSKAVEVQNLGDKISLALTTVIVGMLTIFAVMLLIMLVISLIGKFFEAKSRNSKPKAVNEAKPADSIPAPSESAQAEENQSGEEELVAAITAAVAVYVEQPAGSFRVVSFRKTSSKPAWNKK